MSAFWALTRKASRRMSIYSANVVSYCISGVIMLVIQVSIWNALYAHGARPEATYAETITYVVLVNTVLQVFDIKIGAPIGRSVYDGTIGEDMLRPVNLQIFHIAQQLGGTLFNAFAYSLPLLLVGVIFYGILPPAGTAYFGAFLLSGILGRIIAGLVNLIIGYSAFWLMNNWFMVYFERALMMLFGGLLVPLWFYPSWLASAAAYLPFRYVNYAALELYLGRIPLDGPPAVLAAQLSWVLVLLCAERLIWVRAQKKITVQGG